MSWWRYLPQTWQFYWRTNLAVVLGISLGTAVLVGALVVGDSVRASLRQMTLDRLGRVDHILESPRFFREELATKLAEDLHTRSYVDQIAPAISLVSGVTYQPPQLQASDPKAVRRAGHVQFFGVDERFWKLTETGKIAVPQANEVVLSQRLADQLQITVGSELTAWMEVPASIPRESLLGKRDDPPVQLLLTVSAIIPAEVGVGRFGVRPNQQLPLNAFVSLPTLQTALGVQAQRASRTKPQGAVARVNMLLAALKSPEYQTPAIAEELNGTLSRQMGLRDLDLRLAAHPDRGYVALESERMILDPGVVKAALATPAARRQTTSAAYVYLVNELHSHKSETSYSMYSVVAGLDLSADAPWGPYEFVGPAPTLPLGERDIVLNDWVATDLQAQVGDTIDLKYYVVGNRGELPEEKRQFRVAGIVKLEGTRAADRGLTPEVSGITDAKTLGDWEQPFEMNFKRITKRDDAYWEQHRATPKAFVGLKTAQDLWRSRYGELTALRIIPAPGTPWQDFAGIFQRELFMELDLAGLGFAFIPVKSIGLQAASGSTDFGGLFIGFSFFLILAALILVQLFFRLGLEQRGSQFGVLLAAGVSPQRMQQLLWRETGGLMILGTVLGVFGGVGYAAGMLHGLRTWWNRAIGTQFLFLKVTPLSVLLGAGLTITLSSLVLWLGFRRLRQLPVRSLLTGAIEPAQAVTNRRRQVGSQGRRGSIAVIVAVLLVLLSLSGTLPDGALLGPLSAQVVSFFLAGMLLLYAGLTALGVLIESDRTIAVKGRGLLGLARLSLRNGARNRARTVQTVWLIAMATFVIVAVAAGQRNPAAEAPDKRSGNGGFTLVAESSRPLLFDLNTPKGREALNLLDESFVKGWKQAGEPHVYPFRMEPGDEASCLNLFQSRLPTILGVPPDFIERGGMRFVGGKGENPWEQLLTKLPDGSIPVYGDLNTLQYSLHKGVGAQLNVPNDAAPRAKVEIIGMLDSSIFQGVLLMSEEHFLELFPDRAGARYFLIEAAPEHAAAVADLLETGLESFGFDVERVADRLADFLAVQNTYLSTFQTLGGLGLLLGTIGLATVMLRNIWERRGELALLRAVGYQPRQVTLLILLENAALLFWGLLTGTIAALVAMSPHLLSIGADIAWGNVAITLLAVAIAGLSSAWLAVRAADRLPLLETLRSEM